MPFEAAKKYRMEFKKTVTDNEENNMQLTWIDFCKANDVDQEFTSMGDHEVCGRWMQFVGTAYQPPLPTATEKVWG